MAYQVIKNPSLDWTENRAGHRAAAKIIKKLRSIVTESETFERYTNGVFSNSQKICGAIKLTPLPSEKVKVLVKDGAGSNESLIFKQFELENDLNAVIKKLRELGWQVFNRAATKVMLQAYLHDLFEKEPSSLSKHAIEITKNSVERRSNQTPKSQNDDLSAVERRNPAVHAASRVSHAEIHEEYDGKHINPSPKSKLSITAMIECSSPKLDGHSYKSKHQTSTAIAKNTGGIKGSQESVGFDDKQEEATNKSVDTSKDKPNTPSQLNTVNTNLDRQDGIPPSLTKKSSKDPLVLQVVWDKLAVTFSTPKPDIELLIFTARMLCKHHGDNYVLRPVQTLGRQLYRYRYQLIDHEGNQACLIEFSPKNKKSHFIRIEFNPAEIGAFGISQISRVLKGLFGADYRTHMLDGNLTRIDATVDINHVSPNDVIAFTNRKRTSSIWHRTFEADGNEVWETETLCLGSSSSDYSAEVYDKAIQLWKVKGLVIACKRTRVEASFEPRDKDKKSIKVRDFMAIKNPFAPIFIAYYPAPHEVDYEFNFFLSHVRLNGAEQALGMIKDKHKRALYSHMILDCEVDWWQPDELWAGCIDYIKNTGFFPAEIFEGATNLDK